MKNKEALNIVKQLKDFCENKGEYGCNKCCFVDDEDGHCLLTDSIPTEWDIPEFQYQAKVLIE